MTFKVHSKLLWFIQCCFTSCKGKGFFSTQGAYQHYGICIQWQHRGKTFLSNIYSTRKTHFSVENFMGRAPEGTPLTALQDVGFPEERYFMWLHHTDQVLLPDTIYLSPSTGQKSLSLPYRVAFPSPAWDFRSRSSSKAVSQEQQNGRGWKVRVSLRWWW